MNKFIFLLLFINFNLFSQGHYASANKLFKDLKDNSIISIGKDEQILIWNLKNYKISAKIPLNKGSLTNGVIMTEPRYIVASSMEGILYFISLNTNTLVDIKNLNTGSINNIFYLGKGELLIVSRQGQILLYNYNNDTILKKLKVDSFINTSYLDSNQLLYFTDDKNNIKTLSIPGFKVKKIEFDNSYSISNLMVANGLIYLATWKGQLHIFDLNSLHLIYTFDLSLNNAIIKLIIYKGFIFAGSKNGDLYIYKNKELIGSVKGRNSSIKDFIISENQLIISYEDSCIDFYDLDSLKLIHSFSDY